MGWFHVEGHLRRHFGIRSKNSSGPKLHASRGISFEAGERFRFVGMVRKDSEVSSDLKETAVSEA